MKKDDVISRQMALEEIDKMRQILLNNNMKGAEHILVHYGRRIIEDLPSVNEGKKDV